MRQRSLDPVLLVAMVALTAVGLTMILSSSYVTAAESMSDRYYYLKRHLTYLTAAAGAFFVGYRINLNTLRKFAWPIFILAVFLLVMVLVSPFSKYAGGAYRWLKVGGLRFQPSEFAKLATIFLLAHYVTKEERVISQFRRGLLPPLMLTGVVCMLILSEPDFGSTVSLFLTAVVMLYIAGARFIHLGLCFASVLPLIGFLLMSSPYRRARLFAFLDPWKDPLKSGFQIIQSFIAIRAGGFFGQGIGDGVQKIFYLPEAHTDFVFSVLCEELGFVGTSGVILVYIVLVARGAQIAMRSANRFHAVLAAGLIFAIGLQAVTNMAVVMGLLPTKGLTLPLLSFGGTSLVAVYGALGVLHNIASQNPAYSAKSGLRRLAA